MHLKKLSGKIKRSCAISLYIFPFVHNCLLNGLHSASEFGRLWLVVFSYFPGLAGWAGSLKLEVSCRLSAAMAEKVLVSIYQGVQVS